MAFLNESPRRSAKAEIVAGCVMGVRGGAEGVGPSRWAKVGCLAAPSARAILSTKVLTAEDFQAFSGNFKSVRSLPFLQC